MSIRRMKGDLYGSLNEIDRCVDLARKMLQELRLDLVKIRIAEGEAEHEEDEEEF